MKTLILIISISAISFSLFSQNNIDKVLTEIEKNNTTLQALRKNIDAQKIENKTDIYLQNPEIEFNYLFGKPSVIGNRTDFLISQSFDFPSVYGFKNQISDLKNEQIELEYQKQLKSIQLQTRLICSDLIYVNALKSELSKRFENALNIANLYKLKFESGETNILEFNKAQLNFIKIKNELETLEIEKNELLSNLSLLNGGSKIDFNEKTFEVLVIPTDFDNWFKLAEQNNPMLAWLMQEIELSQKQEKLNKAMSLPKFKAGYMSENVVGQQFQGIQFGMSIPLWENKNTVKFNKSNTIAIESVLNDNKTQLYNTLQSLHSKAVELQKLTNEFKTNFQLFNSSELLKKALDKGEINLIDYLMELSFYYENLNKQLELEKDLNKTVVELNQYN